jgi:hypothetical protein
VGCSVVLILSAALEKLSTPVSGASVQLAALVTGAPVVCLLGVVSSLLAFALPWIAPALTATAIARERELGTLDLLRTTLLTERSIVLGKLAGCLARLWPGILALALLTPFQIVWVAASGSFGLSSLAMAGAVMDSEVETGLFWVWLLLTGVIGWLKPWGELALHAAVGLFVSALARSSSVAIAISYSAILAARVTFYLVSSLANIVLMAVPVALVEMPEATMGDLLAVPALISLGVVLVEFVGAALLMWAAVWWLRRT